MKDEVNGGNEEKMRTNMMTVQEVADYLRISRFSVYNLVKRGKLPTAKVLNKFRFSFKDIEHYLKGQKTTQDNTDQ